MPWPSSNRLYASATAARAPRRGTVRGEPGEVGREPQLERGGALLARTVEPHPQPPLRLRRVAGLEEQRARDAVQLGLVEERALAPRQLQRLRDRGEPRLDRAGAQVGVGEQPEVVRVVHPRARRP